MADWARCLGERETLARMRAGDSVARLGDGEFGIALGGSTATHRPDPRLAEELRGILKDPAAGCLPAIPTMDAKSPRFFNWVRHRTRYRTILDMDRTYGSAFVGQTVSAPWIATTEHADEFRRLWAGKRVVALCPDNAGLNSLLTRDAAAVTWVFCPKIEAYSVVDDLERACLDARAEIAVLVAGPCATVLANRLAAKGLHAIDLGRGVGVILRNWTP